jgi:hypothetical protein
MPGKHTVMSRKTSPNDRVKRIVSTKGPEKPEVMSIYIPDPKSTSARSPTQTHPVEARGLKTLWEDIVIFSERLLLSIETYDEIGISFSERG